MAERRNNCFLFSLHGKIADVKEMVKVSGFKTSDGFPSYSSGDFVIFTKKEYLFFNLKLKCVNRRIRNYVITCI